jgi:hypothetical protein
VLLQDAEPFVMYPSSLKEYPQDKLSQLEIDMATFNVLLGFRSVRGKIACSYLTTE